MSDEADQPTETQPPAETPRYDILAVSQNRAFNVVEQGLKSLINFMQASGFIRVNGEAIAEEWTEVYAKPGPSAHEMFVKGAWSGSEPVVLEVAIRGGTRPAFIPYGGEPEESCYFWIDFRGALFNDLTGKTKLKLKEVLSTRFDLFTRAHTALPPHLEVPPEEAPVDRKLKKEGTPTRVGTAVEEY